MTCNKNATNTKWTMESRERGKRIDGEQRGKETQYNAWLRETDQYDGEPFGGIVDRNDGEDVMTVGEGIFVDGQLFMKGHT